MAGAIDQTRSTHEYSRVMTDSSQHVIAKTMARSKTAPYGVPTIGWLMKLRSERSSVESAPKFDQIRRANSAAAPM